MMVPAPARRAAAADSEPLLPAAPRIATTGPARPALRASTASVTTRWVRAGRTAHVKHRQRQRDGQVAGQHGGDRPAEQDRVPGTRHLLGPAVPAGQAVGHHQRREAERDERRDPVPWRQPERRAAARLLDHPGEHPAGAGDRVVHLAAAGDDLQDRGPDRVRVVVAGLAQLPERCRVEVQPVHPDPHLVRPDSRARIQPPGRLRQQPAGSATRCRPSGEPCCVIDWVT